MENPWTKKNRPFWKIDPVYKEFEKKLYEETWSFEEVCDIVKLDNYKFVADREKIINKMKSVWLIYVNKWNQIEKIILTDKIKGFAAIVYLFVVMPYDQIDCVGNYFTRFEINNINIAYFYSTNGSYLPFEEVDELFDSGPVFPPAYQQWLDKKYESAAWWITLMVFEKINGLEPVIDSEPAKLIKSSA